MISFKTILVAALFNIVSYVSAQDVSKWKVVESKLKARNEIASEVAAFSSNMNLISEEDVRNTYGLLDSLNNSIGGDGVLNKNYVGRISKLNSNIEQIVSAQLSRIEGNSLVSTSGNAVRVIALYNRAKEELYNSISEYNRHAALNKRKDLVFQFNEQ